ncbi:MAG: hypothetical protein IID44_17185, partial [Planctomycetes bacterium]|nr:hypothetical protein [Planctomycetota bacterium]
MRGKRAAHILALQGGYREGDWRGGGGVGPSALAVAQSAGVDAGGGAGVFRLGRRPFGAHVTEPDERGIGRVRYPRLLPRDEESAKALKKRTLTNLYNERPTWLDLAHQRLDQAVATAYAWPHDLTDEQILEKLLE